MADTINSKGIKYYSQIAELLIDTPLAVVEALLDMHTNDIERELLCEEMYKQITLRQKPKKCVTRHGDLVAPQTSVRLSSSCGMFCVIYGDEYYFDNAFEAFGLCSEIAKITRHKATLVLRPGDRIDRIDRLIPKFKRVVNINIEK